MPKESPHTAAAGQISLAPFHPAKAQTSQNGTTAENSGNCRPIIAPRI